MDPFPASDTARIVAQLLEARVLEMLVTDTGVVVVLVTPPSVYLTVTAVVLAAMMVGLQV